MSDDYARALAVARYKEHRDRMIAYGRWNPWVPADKAREHVLWLREQGIGRAQVAAAAGLTQNTVSKLLYGERGNPPTRRIRPETEAAILAVSPDPEILGDRTRIDGTGTRRRLQALAWQGWSMAALAARLGPGRQLSTIISRSVRVHASTAREVRALCRELNGTPPPEQTRGERSAAARARNHARRMGWVPLAAWDAIDDPDARPVDGWQRDDRVRRWGVLIEEVADLAELGVEPRHMADRLGVSASTLSTTLARARKRDAA